MQRLLIRVVALIVLLLSVGWFLFYVLIASAALAFEDWREPLVPPDDMRNARLIAAVFLARQDLPARTVIGSERVYLSRCARSVALKAPIRYLGEWRNG